MQKGDAMLDTFSQLVHSWRARGQGADSPVCLLGCPKLDSTWQHVMVIQETQTWAQWVVCMTVQVLVKVLKTNSHVCILKLFRQPICYIFHEKLKCYLNNYMEMHWNWCHVSIGSVTREEDVIYQYLIVLLTHSLSCEHEGAARTECGVAEWLPIGKGAFYPLTCSTCMQNKSEI